MPPAPRRMNRPPQSPHGADATGGSLSRTSQRVAGKRAPLPCQSAQRGRGWG